MAETFVEYRARVLGYLGTRDPIRVQRATPAALERRIRRLAPAVARRRPAPARSRAAARWWAAARCCWPRATCAPR